MLPLCWIKQFSQKWSGARGTGEGVFLRVSVVLDPGLRCRSDVWMPRALCKCLVFPSAPFSIFKGKENIKKSSNNLQQHGCYNVGKYRALLFRALGVVDIFLFILFPFLWGFEDGPLTMGNSELYCSLDTWTITNKQNTFIGSHPESSLFLLTLFTNVTKGPLMSHEIRSITEEGKKYFLFQIH